MVWTTAPKPRRRELASADSRFPYPQVGVTHLKSLNRSHLQTNRSDRFQLHRLLTPQHHRSGRCMKSVYALILSIARLSAA